MLTEERAGSSMYVLPHFLLNVVSLKRHFNKLLRKKKRRKKKELRMKKCDSLACEKHWNWKADKCFFPRSAACTDLLPLEKCSMHTYFPFLVTRVVQEYQPFSINKKHQNNSLKSKSFAIKSSADLIFNSESYLHQCRKCDQVSQVA